MELVGRVGDPPPLKWSTLMLCDTHAVKRAALEGVAISLLEAPARYDWDELEHKIPTLLQARQKKRLCR